MAANTPNQYSGDWSITQMLHNSIFLSPTGETDVDTEGDDHLCPEDLPESGFLALGIGFLGFWLSSLCATTEAFSGKFTEGVSVGASLRFVMASGMTMRLQSHIYSRIIVSEQHAKTSGKVMQLPRRRRIRKARASFQRRIDRASDFFRRCISSWKLRYHSG